MLPYLTTERLRHLIREALAEDVGAGDYSTLACFPKDVVGKVKLVCKDNGILAGVAMAEHIIAEFDADAQLTKVLDDGSGFRSGDIAFYIEASVQTLLTCERLVLNCMQRMSGIATHTHRLVQMVAHTKCQLLDTRKTTPNFRLAEKWAVHIGGGKNHRFALYDMVMLKDNHIDFCGGIAPAVEKANTFLTENGLDLKIEVEVRTLEEVIEALRQPGIARLLLDNMSPELVSTCVREIAGRLETEASGGINETNLVAYAETGVDFISLGTLTYGARPLDLSLKAVKP